MKGSPGGHRPASPGTTPDGDNPLYQEFDTSIERDMPALVASVQRMVGIRSVAGQPGPGAPFGDGPRMALETALTIAAEQGFRTVNLDNFAGYAECGEGEGYIAILGHLDTVPEGDHWTHPPFAGEIHGGRIYGRGSLDDKGPILAALFAASAVCRSNAVFHHRVRVIFGADEETGDKDMRHYLECEPPPACGFTPDAEFPVVYAEMGILWLNLVADIAIPAHPAALVVTSLYGGESVNMVPGTAHAVLEGHPLVDIPGACREFVQRTGYRVSVNERESRIEIESEGISAHGSKPAEGKNAIMQLLAFLSSLDAGPRELGRAIAFLTTRIGDDTTGTRIGLDLSDEPSSHLTLNVGMIRLCGTRLVVSVDIRYPVTFEGSSVIRVMRDALGGSGFSLEVQKEQPPLHYSPQSSLVRSLSGVYQDVTGLPGTPIAIGGGTYARRLPNIVAFGPYMPGSTHSIHAADESIGIDELHQMARIYARAIHLLASRPGAVE